MDGLDYDIAEATAVVLPSWREVYHLWYPYNEDEHPHTIAEIQALHGEDTFPGFTPEVAAAVDALREPAQHHFIGQLAGMRLSADAALASAIDYHNRLPARREGER